VGNLTRGQTIAIGIMALFGIPLCAGLAVGYFAGFWAGVLVAVVVIAAVATIALRWSAKQVDKEDR
jgi:Flp pilus assembly protein TadB